MTENEALALFGFVLPVLCALAIIWLICRPTFTSRVPPPPPRGHVSIPGRGHCCACHGCRCGDARS